MSKEQKQTIVRIGISVEFGPADPQMGDTIEENERHNHVYCCLAELPELCEAALNLLDSEETRGIIGECQVSTGDCEMDTDGFITQDEIWEAEAEAAERKKLEEEANAFRLIQAEKLLVKMGYVKTKDGYRKSKSTTEQG